MQKFFHNNALSIVFLFLFILCMLGQFYFGHATYNEELIEKNMASVSGITYLSSGHFIQSTFENWESEFLQMALFVWLTIFLFQKGSSESKKFDGTDEVDRKPDPNKKDAPWPVNKGGWIAKLYAHSLTISLGVLFLLSFLLHFYGSRKDENFERWIDDKPLLSWTSYIIEPRFRFESFQNWQSEFLSVFTIIFLSI